MKAKHFIFTAIFAIVALSIFACDELTGSNPYEQTNPNPSSSDGNPDPNNSSSSDGNPTDSSSSGGEEEAGCSNLGFDEFCCFGTPHSKASGSFCFNDELYTLCGKEYSAEPYNPLEQICYQGELKPNCSNDEVTGLCADETGLLRCKQLGSEDNKILDPFPGMKCEDGGIITGQTQFNGNTYNTVQIGTQVWMAENLKELPANLGGVYCKTGTPADNCGGQGLLYSWGTACNGKCELSSFSKRKGVCPSGWHIPSKAEWQQLIDYTGGNAIAGGRLKAKSSWNPAGVDAYGFNALPYGYFDKNNSSATETIGAFWWTSSIDSNNEVADIWFVIESDTEANTKRASAFTEDDLFKYHVRCLQDQ